MEVSLLRSVVDRPLAVRLRRFVLVGAVAAGIQTVLLAAFVALGLNYLVGATVAIEITIVFQYFLNNAWTFGERSNDSRRAFLRGLVTTNVVRGSAIPLQLGVLYALVEWVGPLSPLAEWAGPLWVLVANGVAILVSGVYRYVLDSRFTWGA
ncbi:GtrA family protein [Halomarina oriensis]|uniref:GtrA family protein n=1 Tax=Halomarina oriensis TaxID=671145 RepID=A0A6B0GH12_9EURY|nr:GtrA family protein [Halomarina oriensis]MWG33061.1 GtrA family protein [Halomarina oriensis]